MNATALKHHSVLWRRVTMSIIGFCIGVILYGISCACDYRCDYCDSNEWGTPITIDDKNLCDRCYSSTIMWRAAQRRNAIIGMSLESERKEYLRTGKVSDRIKAILGK